MFTMFKVVLVAGLIILFIKKRSRINQILEKQIILNFILHSDQIIFSSALFFLLFLFVAELILFFVGVSTNNIFDNDFSTQNLAWINKGKVPFIFIVLLFLSLFSILGLTTQYFTNSLINQYVVALVVAFVSIIITRYLSVIVAKFIPEDETTIVSENYFVGKVGTIVIGIGTKDKDVQFKVFDTYNRPHYFMGYVSFYFTKLHISIHPATICR